MKTNESKAEFLSLLKMVHVGVLMSLLWKVKFFWYAVGVNHEFPLADTFFPAFFRSLPVLVAVYLLAVGCSFLILFTRAKAWLHIWHLISVGSLSILCVHQNAYNDVTFLCCTWTCVWCLWLTTRLGEDFDSLYPRAAWLSHLVLSLIFIGGTVGKLSPGYWSGEVLFEIYFRDRDYWTYNFLRESVSADTLRSIATWHSRMVLIFESFCCFLWLLPRKIASGLAVLVLCGIALTNNVMLISVVACLIALALVGLHEPKPKNSS